MKDSNNIIFKNSLILTLRLIINTIIGLVASRLILKALGVTDFGIFSVVGGIVFMLSFVNSILTNTTNRFLSYELGLENGNVNRIFNVTLLIHVIAAIIFVLFVEIFGVYYIENLLKIAPSRISEAFWVLQFAAISMFFSIVSIPYQSMIFAMERFYYLSIVEIVRNLLNLLIALLLMLDFDNKLILYSVLVCINNVLPSILYYLYCKIKYSNYVLFKLYKNREIYKQVFSYTGWNGLGVVAYFSKTTGSELLLNFFFGITYNAAYSIANQLNNLALTFSMNISQATVPQIIKNYSNGNDGRVHTLCVYSSKYTYFFLLIPILPVLLEADQILKIWLSEFPYQAVVFLKLLVIITLFNSITNGLTSFVQATGKIKFFQISLSFITFLVLPISYLLFKHGYTAKWVLIVLLIATILNLVVNQILLQIILKINFNFYFKFLYSKIITITLLLLPLFIFHSYLQEGIRRFVFTILLAEGWLFFCIYFFGISKEERIALLRIFKSLIIRDGKKDKSIMVL